MAKQPKQQPVPDVTIVGAGIIGVCSALALQERGLSVALIDRHAPGSETSHGNAGIISPWSCVPQSMPGIWKSVPKWLLHPEGPLRIRLQEIPKLLPWVAEFFANTRLDRVHTISDAMDMLMRGNMEAYRDHLKGTGREDLIRDSWFINVFRSPAKPNLNDLGWRLRTDRGAPIEIVSGDELREIEPEVSTEFNQAIIQKGQSRAVNPGEVCRVLAEKACQQGAELIRCDVRRLKPQETGAVHLDTDIGEIAAQKVVLCGGVWSTRLLEDFGVKLPLVSERGYHLEFTDPQVSLNNSILDVAGKFIMSSMEGGVRSAGTSEFADVDAPPNFKRADILAPMSKRLIPRLNTEHSRRWVGARPSFPDNLPVIGAMPKVKNLYGAFGHSHYGLGMGPATARLLADSIVGVPANADRSAVAVERFL
ncbi:MAG: FAD-binding oxidoreductase [Pseudomonadota bacterium]